MAPLNLEIYNPERSEWTKAGEVKPGDHPGSLSDNKSDGCRDIYLFDCAPDDSGSTLYQSKAGADTEISLLRVVIPAGGLEVIKELKKGESHEMEVRTDQHSHPHRIRFTHV